MQIIFGKETADQLQDRYTVLELETIEKDGVVVDAFCIVPAEKINLGEMSSLDNNINLHRSFIEGLKNNDYKLCNDLSEHLIGKFGGELDTFYQEILNRLQPK
jgi:hypothetical protein